MSRFPYHLFTQLMQSSPLRPAASFWRALEMQTMISHALPRLKEARQILDMGCGNGRMLSLMRPHLPAYAKITGLDINPIEVAQAEATGLFDRAVCGSAERLPFEDASFDAVLANSVLEHIGPIRTVIDEVGRVLKPGGLFILTVPGPHFHACLGCSRNGVCRAYFERLDNRLIHLRYWDLPQWVERFAPARLSLIDSREYLNVVEAKHWHKLSKLTGGLVFFLTGRKRGPRWLQTSHTACGYERRPSFAMRLWARLFLLGFKEDQAADLFGCLLLVARRDPDPYERRAP